MKIDFEARRCPNAQTYLNMILEGFINSEIKTVTLITIEPSLLRSLRERIAHYEMPISIMDIEECVISDEHIEAWLNDYDEDDFGDVDQISFIKVEKNKT
tara:strand:- start:8132 stop:8431 length:300 start_codon:yes stop_codon:yes gene_type:complete